MLGLDANQIVDIQKLLENVGLGGGDLVLVDYNNLDPNPDSPDMLNIQTLIDRGVTVQYEPQNNQ